jgi:transposase-like protein
MGRPKLVTIDRDRLLVSLVHYTTPTWPLSRRGSPSVKPPTWRGTRRVAQRQTAMALEEALEYGVQCDLERLIGHPLTSTERIRAEAIRSFKSQGWLVRCGKRLLKPTEPASPKLRNCWPPPRRPPMPNPWLAAPIIEIVLPGCPFCSSADYRPIKGWRNDDGTRISRRICKRCREPYIVRTKRPLTPKRGNNNSRAWETCYGKKFVRRERDPRPTALRAGRNRRCSRPAWAGR